jgi:nucleoside-diphosphate kinase
LSAIVDEKVMKTLLMVKPDIVERGLYGEIIAFVLKNRFKIVDLKMFRMDRETAEGFYDVHRERDFFQAVVDYMTSGPLVAMEIEGEDVVVRVRELIGVTDPAMAAVGTIRSKYGTSIQNNAVHASDSAESAKKELAIVFGGS